LGAHSKPSKMKVVPQAATAAAAAPTVAGVAAAICLSPQAPAQAATVPATHTAQQTSSNTAIVPAAYRKAPTPTQLLSASRQAVKEKRAASIPATYTVRAGDSLSTIAKRIYKNPAAWPVLYWANHHKLKWADVINVGQVLKVPADPDRIPVAPRQLTPVRYVPKHAAPKPATTTSEDSTEQAPAQTTQTTQTTTTTAAGWSGTYPGGAFGACVVARESGGNPDIWNASGHWGLYQFSESTWVAYGGAAGDFGSASVAEQNQVFANALAQGGQSNWAPYDGC
jgi:LysM repeat protein